MNSPPDPGSPSVSTPSSGSPPPEEASSPGSHGGGTSSAAISAVANQITSHISSFLGTGHASKRRLPGGSSFGAVGGARDPKSRRREDSRRQGGGGNGAGVWVEGKDGGGKRNKDDLVDPVLVEVLRKEIGDPFTETVLRAAS